MSQQPDRREIALPLDERNGRERRYREWLAENPRFWELVDKYAKEALARGRRFSTRTMVAVMRWNTPMEWEKDQGFKINDHISPYLARDLIRLYPGLRDLLELRRVEGEVEL